VKTNRVLLLTLAVSIVGAVNGALCGLLAAAPIALSQWLRPSAVVPDVSASDVMPYLAAGGAAFGAALVPALAFGVLRAAPLWQVCGTLLLGVASGTAAWWVVAYFGGGVWWPLTLPISAGLGALGAALWLRHRLRGLRPAEA
jgi:hypothetical protein